VEEDRLGYNTLRIDPKKFGGYLCVQTPIKNPVYSLEFILELDEEFYVRYPDPRNLQHLYRHNWEDIVKGDLVSCSKGFFDVESVVKCNIGRNIVFVVPHAEQSKSDK
jgi:hypothetical protein